MKCYIAYKRTPLTKRQLLRCVKGNCNHVPLFACSWRWLARLVGFFLNAELYHESLDELGCPEVVDDEEFVYDYTPVWRAKL